MIIVNQKKSQEQHYSRITIKVNTHCKWHSGVTQQHGTTVVPSPPLYWAPGRPVWCLASTASLPCWRPSLLSSSLLWYSRCGWRSTGKIRKKNYFRGRFTLSSLTVSGLLNNESYLQQQETSSDGCCCHFANLLKEIPYTPRTNDTRRNGFSDLYILKMHPFIHIHDILQQQQAAFSGSTIRLTHMSMSTSALRNVLYSVNPIASCSPSTQSSNGDLCAHGIFLSNRARVIPKDAIPPPLPFGIFCQIHDLVVDFLL